MWGRCGVDVGSIGGRCICGWKIYTINEEVEVEVEEGNNKIVEEGRITTLRSENDKNCREGGNSGMRKENNKIVEEEEGNKIEKGEV